MSGAAARTGIIEQNKGKTLLEVYVWEIEEI